MLVSLHVKNLALIEETEVWFQKGLNILTGETGAGKSIIIGSVALALGAKADRDLIRTGCEDALIELAFELAGEEQWKRFLALELPFDEKGHVLIARRIMASRSVSRVNGETVTARQLKELAGVLLDIHGQHEHQALLHARKHFEVLDAYAADSLKPCLAQLKSAYNDYRQLQKELAENEMDDTARRRELALAEFELEEIRSAELAAGEDEQLEQRYRKMANAKRIGEAAARACAYAQGGEEMEAAPGASDCIGRALRELNSVAEYDDGLNGLAEQLSEIESLLQDFGRELADYLSDLSLDEADFLRTGERLNEINRLKAKYGNSIPKILQYADSLQEQCDRLNDYEAYRTKLSADREQAKQRLHSLCEQASRLRKEAAEVLQQRMRSALLDLNFEQVGFEIAVGETENYREDGFNEVEFMISTNPGEPLKPLGSVASGGELSRIMLAIKAVLADRDDTDTLIFDEIDAGISGRTAWRVSEKLAVIGREHQVICITHLPQIAAMADAHFAIEKRSDGHSTATQIRRLTQQEEIEELARLLGGDKPSESTYQNARELKEQAVSVKNKK